MSEARDSRLGRAFVVAIAVLLGLGIAVALVYKWSEPAPARLAFERWDGPFAGNATDLPFKPVHAAYFLEDHLETAVAAGASQETVLLRVDAMADTLRQLTGQAGPDWWVRWDGRLVHVHLDGSA